MSTRAIAKLIISAAVISPETNLKCCKRSELPLYMPPEKPEETTPKFHTDENSSLIEDTIRSVRLSIDNVVQEVRKYEDKGKTLIQDGVDNAQWLFEYLGDEENQAPKAPAIAIGGLTGFILALRGGFFKKAIYTSVGAMGMAAICYPKEAKEYGTLATDEGYKYATIAYNFIYGVKKGDKPLELPTLPKMPGSVSEMVSMISNFATSQSSASITDKEANKKDTAEEKVKDDKCRWIPERDLKIMNSEGEVEEDKKSIEYYEGNKCCPCHMGSCMHTNSKDDCPEELPYPDPTPPPPPKSPPHPDCEGKRS